MSVHFINPTGSVLPCFDVYPDFVPYNNVFGLRARIERLVLRANKKVSGYENELSAACSVTI